jgi:sugar porter (SP) family MFS transporter
LDGRLPRCLRTCTAAAMALSSSSLLLLPLQHSRQQFCSIFVRSSLPPPRLPASDAAAAAAANLASAGGLSNSYLRKSSLFPIIKRMGSGRTIQVKKDMTDVDSEGGLDTEPLLQQQQEEEKSKAAALFNWTSVSLPFIFPALGGLMFGYDIGATSGAVVSLTSPELSGIEWYNLTALQTGLVVSGSLYGALLGSIVAFNVADALGRRKELMLAAFLYIVGALVTGGAPDLFVLFAGRLIYGIGIGLAMHAAPMYIAETAPTQIRGTLISLKEGFIVGGILLGYLVGSIMIGVEGGWRMMFGFGAPIALLMGVGMWWLPPSPRWLLLRGLQGGGEEQEFKARASSALLRLRGNRFSQNMAEEQVEDTWMSLQAAAEGQELNVSLAELFQGVNLKALLIGTGLVFFQQVTGQPSVLYYAAPILQNAGFSVAADATKLSVLLGFFKLIMTGIAVVNVDKLGRRPLLIGGVSGIVISLFLLAAYFTFGQGVPVLAVIALLLYVGCYQVSFGPISWLMVSEIFPLRIRGKALGVTTLVNFGSNAVVALAFAPLQDLVGVSATFIIFGIIGLISLIFIVLAVPETKGLSLEEIEAKLLGQS